MLSGIADLDDMLPLLLIAIPFAFAPVAMPGYALPWWGLCLLPLGLGAVMGTMCAALLRFEARASCSAPRCSAPASRGASGCRR
jgi:hypothetical protein